MSSSLVDAIQESIGVSEAQLKRLIARSPHSYKVYTIPKKSGGTRVIAQPAKETKFLQRWLMTNVFDRLPLHSSAVAYRSGASIKLNAIAHKDNEYLSKFDFQQFFPSIKESDLLAHFGRHLGDSFSAVDIKTMARLACIAGNSSKDLFLSIGAPSSPMLSNSIMYEFDCTIDLWCKLNEIVYTRYADDLAFSTNIKGISAEIEAKIASTIDSLQYPRLSLNKKKTIHLSKKYQRRITGLIINNESEISLGRARKREISTLVHRCSIGLLSSEQKYYLQGLLGFAKDVEPAFVMGLKGKYGAEVVDAVLQVRKNK